MNVEDITFGVEIETTLPRGTLAVGPHGHGCDIPALTGWKADRDPSIRARNGQEACEFVSPVLKGSEGLKQLLADLAVIRGLGAKVNTSCGLHVHVGIDKNDAELTARLITLVSNFEKAIYASTGTKRRERSRWCNGLNHYGDAETARQSGQYSRYHVANLATGTKPTVEFRAFAATLDAVKLSIVVRRIRHPEASETPTGRKSGPRRGELFAFEEVPEPSEPGRWRFGVWSRRQRTPGRRGLRVEQPPQATESERIRVGLTWLVRAAELVRECHRRHEQQERQFPRWGLPDKPTEFIPHHLEHRRLGRQRPLGCNNHLDLVKPGFIPVGRHTGGGERSPRDHRFGRRRPDEDSRGDADFQRRLAGGVAILLLDMERLPLELQCALTLPHEGVVPRAELIFDLLHFLCAPDGRGAGDSGQPRDAHLRVRLEVKSEFEHGVHR